MSARNAPLVVSSVEDIRAAMNGDAGSWSLAPEDFAAIERLPSIYALCFDSVQSYLAAELYTEDAELHMGGPPSIGKDAIRKSFEGQAKLRADGKMRLRSRHHMSNIVIRPDPDVPGLEASSVTNRLRTQCMLSVALSSTSGFQLLRSSKNSQRSSPKCSGSAANSIGGGSGSGSASAATSAASRPVAILSNQRAISA